jgi:RHS repeat-associated protein
MLMTEAGKLAWKAQLDIYGVPREEHAGIEDSDATENPWRYPGQYEDRETGLYYNRFRYYDPEAGRYISEDPIGLRGGLSQYGYVHDPLWWTDAGGLAGNPADATHITYLGIDKATGKPYIGYASMPGVQKGEDVLKYRYSSDFGRFQEQPKVLFEGFGKDAKSTARGLEQRTFEDLGGLAKTANKQSPVGPNNLKRADYLKAADEHRAELKCT